MMKKTILVEIQGENREIHLGFDGIRVNIKDLKSKFNLRDNDDVINFFITLISKLETQYNQSTIQIFNPEFIISPEHIITAFYYTHKVFSNKTNISNQKNIEFLLYISTKRQISEAIKYFDIKIEDINPNSLINLGYFIASYEKNIDLIKKKIIEEIDAVEDSSLITEKSSKNLQKIINFFNISISQLKIYFYSHEKKFIADNFLNNNKLTDLYNACLEIILEKMVLLSLEKVSIE